jgi:hypothetical protein
MDCTSCLSKIGLNFLSRRAASGGLRRSSREKIRPTVVGWRSDQAWRNVDNLQHGAPVTGVGERNRQLRAKRDGGRCDCST